MYSQWPGSKTTYHLIGKFGIEGLLLGDLSGRLKVSEVYALKSISETGRCSDHINVDVKEIIAVAMDVHY